MYIRVTSECALLLYRFYFAVPLLDHPYDCTARTGLEADEGDPGAVKPATRAASLARVAGLTQQVFSLRTTLDSMAFTIHSNITSVRDKRTREASSSTLSLRHSNARRTP